MKMLKTWRAERAAKKQAERERAAQIKRERDEYNEKLYGRIEYACPIKTCDVKQVSSGEDLIGYNRYLINRGIPSCHTHEVDMVVTKYISGVKHAEVWR